CVPQNIGIYPDARRAAGGAPACSPGITAEGRSGAVGWCRCVCHVVCCIVCFRAEWFTTSPHTSPRFATSLIGSPVAVNSGPQDVGEASTPYRLNYGRCSV